MYVCMYVCMYVYIYIYIYISRLSINIPPEKIPPEEFRFMTTQKEQGFGEHRIAPRE